MIKVLFVCLGNICRSPLAEAIFKQRVIEKNLEDQIFTDSAGTANYHIGENPDHRSIAVAVEHGIPISHKGRQYKYQDALEFDYILAMDSNNFRDIIHLSAARPEGLFLMRDFDPEAKGADVPDPYYGGKDGFEQVYQMLDRSIEQLLEYIIQEQSL